MRFIIIGAGAIGGVLAGRLVGAGFDVVAVARGEHADAMRDRGLRLATPAGSEVVDLRVLTSIGDVGFRDGDLAVLAVKSQHTGGVLEELRTAASPATPVVCVQNGVENERVALRLFENVYGVCVMCPAGHLTPGRVEAYSWPTPGILDVGRYPSGSDAVADELAAAFSSAGFASRALPDVMRWKYRKLILNLANAVEAVCGRGARQGGLVDVVRREGEVCLAAAGIEVASEAEDAERREGLITPGPVDGERAGGSTWQSLHRATGSWETDYLTGEIVLLGRLHGVPTPANDLLQRLTAELVHENRPPGSVTQDDVLWRLGVAPPSAQ